MVRKLTGITLVLIALADGRAFGQATTYKLTIHAAPLPAPVLKYRLLPPILEQTPGNAALLYYRAFSPEWEGWRRKPGMQEKIEEALHEPVTAKTRNELSWVNGSQFHELDLAARREYCDWGFTERVRTEGIGMLLPDIQSFRAFGQGLALRSRMYLAERDFAKAAHSLQTGFALGKDVGNAPILINALVGVAISMMQTGQVDEWIQTPGSPNLYWALTEMPRPFIDLHKPLEGERLWLYAELPLLRDIDKTQLSPQQVETLADSMARLITMEDQARNGMEAKIALMALALKFYPEAREALIADGRKREEVEALPMLQVYVIHALHQYQKLQDDLFKWYSLPYAEARDGLQKADGDIRRARERFEAAPFINLLPAIVKVSTATARLDRRIAAQRCLEAIRLYAAEHDGRLPAALAEITSVPVPIDPMLGRPFDYRVAGDRALLSAPAPSGTNPASALTYELVMSR